MEITEISNNNELSSLIVENSDNRTNIKDLLTPLEIPTFDFLNLNNNDDDDDDDDDYAEAFRKLSEEDKNNNATEDEKDIAIEKILCVCQ